MRGDKWDRGDGFYQTQGSSQWPSDDPEDSPSDRFECKLCKYTFVHQMYGQRYVGDPTPEAEVRDIIRAHMLYHLAKESQ